MAGYWPFAFFLPGFAVVGWLERILMGVFFWGYIAGEVLFAEVLVTPTGVSKGCGYVPSFVLLISCLYVMQHCGVCISGGCPESYP